MNNDRVYVYLLNAFGVELRNIAKVEPVEVKFGDMKVRASARILEKGVDTGQPYRGGGRTQGRRQILERPLHGVATSEDPTLQYVPGRGFSHHGGEQREKDQLELRSHNARPKRHCGRGGRPGDWGDPQGGMGPPDTDRSELEEPGWTTSYTDGSRLDDKAAGSYTRNCHGGFHDAKAGSEYLGIKATHHDGELSRISDSPGPGGSHACDTDGQQVGDLGREEARPRTCPTTL